MPRPILNHVIVSSSKGLEFMFMLLQAPITSTIGIQKVGS
jgi:hypothetical protein